MTVVTFATCVRLYGRMEEELMDNNRRIILSVTRICYYVSTIIVIIMGSPHRQVITQYFTQPQTEIMVT